MRKLDWDYTQLAEYYLARPPYAVEIVNKTFAIAGLKQGDLCCDVGAGTGNLTVPLAERGLIIDAVEPNAAMRQHGVRRTKVFGNAIRWNDSRAEDTGLIGDKYKLVSFGSSFNVTERSKALRESARLLRPDGWFLCLWNHRDLTDPLQAEIEDAIRRWVPKYDYGPRREDQSEVIATSGFFDAAIPLEASTTQTIDVVTWLEAWRSHATLARQAGNDFVRVLEDIKGIVGRLSVDWITVPYTTRGWIAPRSRPK